MGGVEVEPHSFLISAVGGVSRQSYSQVAVPPGKQPPVPVEKVFVGASDSVWALWKRDNRLVPSDNRTTIRGTNSL